MKINLDWVDDAMSQEMGVEELCAIVSTEVAKFAPNIKISLVTNDGPGGGAPIFEFEGNEVNLRKFLHDCYCQNGAEDIDAEVDFFMEDAED